jgi:pimeloyl-ACP methyl ester carboxylesterase
VGWFTLAVLLLAFVGLLYFAAVYAVSCWLTRPTRDKPAETPSDHGFPWEALHCYTSDGLRLAGWVLSAPQPRGTVVLFHGLRGSRVQMLSRAVMLACGSYRCVAFDHRAHGDSNGRRTTFGYHEARDVAAVMTYVRQRWPAEPFAVLGLSMGAAAIGFAADEVRDVQAVILESLYHDIAGAFLARLGTLYPLWFRPLAPGIIWTTERRLGVRLADVVPAEYIGKLAPAPILLLTGSDDEHAGPDEARRLQARCPGPNELWIVPGADHWDVFEVAGKEYQEKILSFLNKCLPARTNSPTP